MKRKGTPLAAPYAKRPALTLAQTQEVQRQVKRTIDRQKDYKICTREVGPVGVDFAGSTYNLLNDLVRGDNARNNFEGAHIQIKNIHIRGNVSVGDNSNIMRVVIFQWMDDTPPTTISILDNTGIIGGVNAPYATRNWSNRPLYKILRDDLFDLQATSLNAGGPNGNIKVLDYWIKSKKITKTFYAATSGAVQKGSVWMTIVSDSGSIPNPQLTFTCEIVFTDE